jgi:hypothetical protein
MTGGIYKGTGAQRLIADIHIHLLRGGFTPREAAELVAEVDDADAPRSVDECVTLMRQRIVRFYGEALADELGLGAQ